MAGIGFNTVGFTPLSVPEISSGEQEIVAALSTSESTTLLSNVIVDIIIEAEKSISITESKTAALADMNITIEAICSVSSSNGLIPEVNYDKILTVQKTASISSALPLSINILIEAERSTSSSNSPIPLISHGQKMKPNVAESRSAILSTIVNYDYIVQALESVSISGSFSDGI